MSDELLLLVYRPDNAQDPVWPLKRLRETGEVQLRKSFRFRVEDLVHPHLDGHGASRKPLERDDWELDFEDEQFAFRLGQRVDDYFKIDPRIVGTDHTFFFHREIRLIPKYFIATRDISILKHIDRQVTSDVYVGGPREGSISHHGFLEVLRRFPTTTEMNKYAAARVEAVLRDFLDTKSDAVENYERYLNRRISARPSGLRLTFAQHETAKYQTLLERLNEMLAAEAAYTERQWQKEIVQIIQVIYPKYIHVLEDVAIRDTLNSTSRRLDMMLVDACGHVDVIEIKKPFERSVLSSREYRDNFVPAKELIGAVMQLEKYLFYLSKWGSAGEQELTRRYGNQLPPELKLKIVNPSGFIILGREREMSLRQREDFEVIKRQYRSIVDVITYDDLLARLRILVESFSADRAEA